MEKRIVAKNVLLKYSFMRNQAELHYNILKECAEKDIVTTGDFKAKFEISQSEGTYKVLEDLNFIKLSSGDRVELLPQGYAAYLAISSQKQSTEQAQKATLQAIKAIKYAAWALWISIASFIASLIFSILSCLK